LLNLAVDFAMFSTGNPKGPAIRGMSGKAPKGASSKSKSITTGPTRGLSFKAKLAGGLSGKVKAKPANDAPATFSGNFRRKKSTESKAPKTDSKRGLMSFSSSLSFKSENASADIMSKIEDREEEEYEKSVLEVWRLRIKRFLAYSIYGSMYEWSLHVLSILSCLIYIYQTYLSAEEEAGAEIYGVNYLNAIELITAGIFTFDFVLDLFIADHRWEHLRR
jgi:hypothetical protein